MFGFLVELNVFSMVARGWEVSEKWRQRFFSFWTHHTLSCLYSFFFFCFFVWVGLHFVVFFCFVSFCFFFRMLRSSGSETLAPGHLVTCHWCGFPVMSVYDCPKKGQGKKWELIIYILNSREARHWNKKSYFCKGKSTICSAGRGFFPPLLIFPSSLDSLPPASSFFNAPICE